MFAIQNVYCGVNTAFIRIGAHIVSVTFEAYSIHFVTIVHFTSVIALALGVPNAYCNDPFVQILRTGLTAIINILMGLGVTIAVIGIIVGGLMRATAFGSEQRIAMSNKAISSAVIGLVIVLLGVALGTAIPTWFGQQANTCPLGPLQPPIVPNPTSAPAPTPTPTPTPTLDL